MINVIDKKDCCGCEACVQQCPKHCITMELDDELFYYPVVDAKSCVSCGLCEDVCPQLHADVPRIPLKVFAAKNLDDEERLLSSSGGIFMALARHFIEQHGVVYGVVYDSDWNVCFTYTENIEGVKAMVGSKYVQAKVGGIYKKVKVHLKEGRVVLFTGTPCQIAALKRFLRKEYDNLFLLDVLCAGVPSPGVWRKYFNENVLSAAQGAAVGKNTVLPSLNAISSIEGITFRDKSQHGWEKFSFVVKGNSASKADKNSVLLSSIHSENSYMRGFLSSLYKRRSCHVCKFRDGESHSDITVADFWGIKQLMPDFADDKGVSLVLVWTIKGSEVFSSLPLDFRESNYVEVKSLNGGFKNQKINSKRGLFYELLRKEESFDVALKRALHVSWIMYVLSFFIRAFRKILCIIK